MDVEFKIYCASSTALRRPETTADNSEFDEAFDELLATALFSSWPRLSARASELILELQPLGETADAAQR